jgi:hypothetical protein
MIGHLGGHDFFRVVSDGDPYAIMSPLPCSSYAGALSFFPICPYFFGELPLFYCIVFGPGFACCVGFLVAMFPPVDVLDDPASTSFPLGMFLVVIWIF